MTQSLLPDQFRDLEPFMAWALATEKERCTKRQASSFTTLKTFYDAMLPRMEQVLPFLAQFSLENVDPQVQHLFLLSLSLAEVAPAVENFGQASVVDGYDVARFVTLHE